MSQDIEVTSFGLASTGLEIITWSGIGMDLSLASVQDVAAKHFDGMPTVVSIYVGKAAWNYAKDEVARWNSVSLVTPLAVHFNLFLRDIESHNWAISNGKVKVCMENAP